MWLLENLTGLIFLHISGTTENEKIIQNCDKDHSPTLKFNTLPFFVTEKVKEIMASYNVKALDFYNKTVQSIL